MRLTTALRLFGRDGRSGVSAAVDVDEDEVVAVAPVVEAIVDALAAGAMGVAVFMRKPSVGVWLALLRHAWCDSDLPAVAAAPALSHGLGGDTDAMSVSESPLVYR